MSHEVPQPDHVYRNSVRYGRLLPMRSPARELYMKRILIIEDDRDIVELVRYNLANEGFQVSAAYDGGTGLTTLKKTPPDLLLLDLMLPKLSGLEICREIRRDDSLNRLPILMLTARGEEADRVVGLEMGADDYVTKPFSPRELVARVKALLRRAEGPGDSRPAYRSRLLPRGARRKAGGAQHSGIPAALLPGAAARPRVLPRPVARRRMGHGPLRYPAQRGRVRPPPAREDRSRPGKTSVLEDRARRGLYF